MINREKVIKGLECCLGDTRADLPNLCTICPYAHDYYATQTCGKKLREDVITLLKAQEPRIISLEEIHYATFGWMEASEQLIPCVLEDIIYVDDTIGFASIDDGHNYMCESDYGKTWRVWTSRPTDEQREATPWMT